MTRIFLIGYMGAGKTTLGKAFAREMSLNFIDLDWFIEERFHKTGSTAVLGTRRRRIPGTGTENVARSGRV